jgi:hypothetical protein
MAVNLVCRYCSNEISISIAPQSTGKKKLVCRATSHREVELPAEAVRPNVCCLADVTGAEIDDVDVEEVLKAAELF